MKDILGTDLCINAELSPLEQLKALQIETNLSKSQFEKHVDRYFPDLSEHLSTYFRSKND